MLTKGRIPPSPSLSIPCSAFLWDDKRFSDVVRQFYSALLNNCNMWMIKIRLYLNTFWKCCMLLDAWKLRVKLEYKIGCTKNRFCVCTYVHTYGCMPMLHRYGYGTRYGFVIEYNVKELNSLISNKKITLEV